MKRGCQTCANYMCVRATDMHWCAKQNNVFSVVSNNICDNYADSPSLIYDISYIDDNGIPITEHVNLIDDN